MRQFTAKKMKKFQSKEHSMGAEMISREYNIDVALRESFYPTCSSCKSALYMPTCNFFQ